jgi:glycosyltransferase involved in cell wall biosynthesis
MSDIPFLTCLIISHNKPKYVCEAIGSISNQIFTNWRAIVIDSGVLYDSGYFDQLDFKKDSRFTLVRSLETDELKATGKVMHSWCVNECFRKGLVDGEFVMYLCDDDWLYSQAFGVFYDFYQQHPEVDAMYGGMDFILQKADGSRTQLPTLHANVNRGSFCGGPGLYCQVDGGQICHKVNLLSRFPNDEYWPEHQLPADAHFLEKLGSITTIYATNFTIGCNRKVPESVNDHRAQ